VRELENVIERVAALTDTNHITIDDLPPNVSGALKEMDEHTIRVTNAGIDLAKTVTKLEMKMIDEALAISGGVKARAAALLNLNRTTLVEKMRRLGMQL
jgi:DNA-binding NtrC family response regulator